MEISGREIRTRARSVFLTTHHHHVRTNFSDRACNQPMSSRVVLVLPSWLIKNSRHLSRKCRSRSVVQRSCYRADYEPYLLSRKRTMFEVWLERVVVVLANLVF